MHSPVLFLIFNRPDTTKAVFSAIRKARPPRLYVAADGPRADKQGEAQKCAETRDIIKGVDWDCEVRTLFRDENLGCREAVSSAISWFFNQEEQGIILEDDCLPSGSFFAFCDDLLDRYKDDGRIAMISGDNFRKDVPAEKGYYATRIPHIWGWATWRRTWQQYDVAMEGVYPFIKDDALKQIWPRKRVRKYWYSIFKDVERGMIDTWDYQLAFSVFKNKTICLSPRHNLVSNIGFGLVSTNTLVEDVRVAGLDAQELTFPLEHPSEITYSADQDDYVMGIMMKNFYLKKALKRLRIFGIIKKIYALYHLRKQ